MSGAKPIIVIKKKGAHAGHHGGAWKVAYADFATPAVPPNKPAAT